MDLIDLTVVFIILKLCDQIDWNWSTVFIPLYIQLIAIIVYVIFMLINDYIN